MANLRISELDSAPMVSGTYVFPASSTDSTYKISFDQLSSWITSKSVMNNVNDYSLTSYDTKSIITFNNTDPVLFTIPNDTNQYVSIGTTIELIRLGGGIVNITGDSNVTVNSSIGWTLRGVYSKATVTKINGNTWIVSGDLALSPTPTPSVTPPATATPTPTPTITVTPSITPSSEPFGPPAAPLNLSARGANEAIVLSWDYPLRDGRSSVTDYIVEYEVDPSVSPTPTMTSTPTPTPTHN